MVYNQGEHTIWEFYGSLFTVSMYMYVFVMLYSSFLLFSYPVVFARGKAGFGSLVWHMALGVLR